MNSTSSNSDGRLELLRSKMEQLRVRFVERTVNDAAALLDALEQGDRVEIGARAHRLAGIAATFGYPAIGQQAFNLQQAIADKVSVEDLEVAVRRLVALLEKCNLPSD